MAIARPVPIPAITRPTDKARTAPPAQIQAQAVPATRFRRCTFRRIEASTGGRNLTVYSVDCMFPDRVTPLPLGDLNSAHPVCANCTNQGIFRPDAD
jgi:hypothetical protein